MLLELLVKHGRSLSVTCSPNRPFERTAATVGLIAVLTTAAGVPFQLTSSQTPKSEVSSSLLFRILQPPPPSFPLFQLPDLILQPNFPSHKSRFRLFQNSDLLRWCHFFTGNIFLFVNLCISRHLLGLRICDSKLRRGYGDGSNLLNLLILFESRAVPGADDR